MGAAQNRGQALPKLNCFRGRASSRKTRPRSCAFPFVGFAVLMLAIRSGTTDKDRDLEFQPDITSARKDLQLVSI